MLPDSPPTMKKKPLHTWSLKPKDTQIVVISDDGSSDLAGEIAERLCPVVIRHEQNLGYGATLQSLFKKAKALQVDTLMTIADGQHDPAQIPLLVNPIKVDTAEVVLGSRFLDKKGSVEMPRYRKFGVKLPIIHCVHVVRYILRSPLQTNQRNN